VTSVITKGKINASPDQVWAIVSKFEEHDRYFPPVARSEGSGSGVGMERQCTILIRFRLQSMWRPCV
jgi:hypothetical protein